MRAVQAKKLLTAKGAKKGRKGRKEGLRLVKIPNLGER